MPFKCWYPTHSRAPTMPPTRPPIPDFYEIPVDQFCPILLGDFKIRPLLLMIHAQSSITCVQRGDTRTLIYLSLRVVHELNANLGHSMISKETCHAIYVEDPIIRLLLVQLNALNALHNLTHPASPKVS
jgi:hypothetical protein